MSGEVPCIAVFPEGCLPINGMVKSFDDQSHIVQKFVNNRIDVLIVIFLALIIVVVIGLVWHSITSDI